MLKGKKIILGITGSIAAYKAAILVRLLIKEGAEVKVVMTPLAKEFITPLTLATLAKNPILVDFFNPENGDWNSHVDLGLWADLYIIAPATANTISKIAYGNAESFLLATILALPDKIRIMCPAMNTNMWENPITQENIDRLKKFGWHMISPVEGMLACGDLGMGKLPNTREII